ncbi:MAG: LysM peptidoglycan-binding domain-containing protein, partial [Pseudomonadota bacterium]
MAVLKRVNRIRGHIIRAGKALMIPGPGSAGQTYALSATERLKSSQSSGKGEKTVHVVRQGDTLWDIARQYKSSVGKISRWNNITPKTPLRLGSKLVIWRPSQSANKGSASTSATIPASKVGPATLQTIRYTVRAGDSLDRIANRFNIRVTDLLRWNSG